MQPMVIKGVVIPLSKQADIPPSTNLTIRSHSHSTTKVIQDQSLMGFGETKFPWETSILDPSPPRSACSTIMARDENVIGSCLCDTAGHDADTYF